MVKGKIAPYFRNTGLTLDGIQAKHIQSFYLHELKSVSPGTVIHYHANIHKALKYAVKMDLIPFNPLFQKSSFCFISRISYNIKKERD